MKPAHFAYQSPANPDEFLQLNADAIVSIEIEAHGRGEGDGDELPNTPLAITGYIKTSLARDLKRFKRFNINERKEHYRAIFATCPEAIFEREFTSALTVIRRLNRGEMHSSAAISISMRSSTASRKSTTY
jgi:hypothetical protein